MMAVMGYFYWLNKRKEYKTLDKEMWASTSIPIKENRRIGSRRREFVKKLAWVCKVTLSFMR